MSNENNQIMIISGNVGIVRAQDNCCATPTPLNTKNLPEYYGTIMLPVAESVSVVADDLSSLKFAFGSWAVSGGEDKQLDEIYKSRSVPSAYRHD